MRTIRKNRLVREVQDKLVELWLVRIPHLATLDEAEEQERIMAEEIVDLVLRRSAEMEG